MSIGLPVVLLLRKQRSKKQSDSFVTQRHTCTIIAEDKTDNLIHLQHEYVYAVSDITVI